MLLDQRIKEREHGEMGGEAIISNIFIKGGRLFEGGD